MKEVIFREYDIRGKIGSELILEEVYPLGHALARHLLSKNPLAKTVAIGMDGRIHSPAIAQELARAHNDAGLQVIFLGICPTPVLYFAVHTLSVDAGLMVTASHNGPEYNGIKICIGTRGVWGNELKEIAKLYRQHVRVQSDSTGTTTELSIIPQYVSYLKSHFPALENMPLSLVIDCGNGTAGTVLPALIEAFAWQKVQLLYPEVDGTYPHHPADPVVPENMNDVKNILATSDIAFGIGLDGDCDRMAAMTKEGMLIPGDVLLSLFALAIAQTNPAMRVVFDIKSSSGLKEKLEEMGAVPVMSRAGHSIIKDVMKEHKAILGGELSCHFFFADRYFGYDDAIYAALRLCELILELGKPLSELVELFPKKCTSPEYRVGCAAEDKSRIIAQLKRFFQDRDDAQLLTLDGVHVTLPYGWGIIRPSNTQSVLSMRFEAATPEDLNQVKHDFKEALKPFFEEQFLSRSLELSL